ncbi:MULTISPECIES: hypothetical protein [Streptomyces]|uniref:hypothetical protein n=1 Tax=Streptomyces TaxID=1883 RepID=UPI001028C827|nr:hypothetical protein [Streptomyces sp. BK022]RZU29896.1 hypothetical protein EV284_4844 [Streptomyces sp. BK022]
MTAPDNVESGAREYFETMRDTAAAKAKGAEQRLRFWNFAHVALGSAAAMAAAAAGGTGLAEAGLRVLAGVLALVSASLTAALGFVRPDQRIANNKRAHKAWSDIERAARAELVMLSVLSHEETRAALDRMRADAKSAYDAYGTTVPQP